MFVPAATRRKLFCVGLAVVVILALLSSARHPKLRVYLPTSLQSQVLPLGANGWTGGSLPGPGPDYERFILAERALPQHNLDTLSSAGKQRRYVKFANQIRALGWNNVLNDVYVILLSFDVKAPNRRPADYYAIMQPGEQDEYTFTKTMSGNLNITLGVFRTGHGRGTHSLLSSRGLRLVDHGKKAMIRGALFGRTSGMKCVPPRILRLSTRMLGKNQFSGRMDRRSWIIGLNC